METINFSYNWNNKLQCHYYTTLRINSPRFRENNMYDIILKGKKIHDGRIIKITLLSLDKINEYIGGLDTGYSAEDCKNILTKMYKNIDLSKEIICLLLIRNESWFVNLNEQITENTNRATKEEINQLINP